MRFALFNRNFRRFIQNNHPVIVSAVNLRRQRRRFRNFHRFRVRISRDAIRRHLDDALIIASQLSVHQNVQNAIRRGIVVPVRLDCFPRRLREFVQSHNHVRRRSRYD